MTKRERKQERKERIKAENARRGMIAFATKHCRPAPEVTHEEFEREMRGFTMIALGLMEMFGLTDKLKRFVEPQGEREAEQKTDYVN